MMQRSYVRQMSKEVDLESLKMFYRSAPEQELAMGTRYKTLPKCFYVNEIGIKAVTEKNPGALDFLVECLNSPEKSVRYVVFGFLGDISHFHPGFEKALRQFYEKAREEKDLAVKEIIKSSMRRLSRQVEQARMHQLQQLEKGLVDG